LSRIGLAFSSFFSILFRDTLPEEAAKAYGYVKAGAVTAKTPSAAKTASAVPKAPEVKTSDGALQMLGILQRDGRLVDLLMEDISGAEDDQIGAAFRSVQEQCRDSLEKYFRLAPVIDGVEGSYTKIQTNDPAVVKLLGNVPASGKAQGGLLRHKGWRAERVDLPKIAPSQKPEVIAPAEVEIE
jgi:Domain of unknown function (DUF2760)